MFTSHESNNKERMVVIGGGFAGLNLVKHLDKRKYEIILVDRNNYHSFPPLFYQIASSGLDPGSISFPFRRELRKYKKKGVRFHMGDVSEIDTDHKVIKTNNEEIPYDKLVIAAGTTNNFFGNQDLVKYVFTLKSTAEAIRCRNEILERLERASTCRDEAERKELLSFVVVGGGPTGVEVAGAIGEMKRYILPREYPDIPVDDLKITIVEGSDRLLRSMSETAQREVVDYLHSLLVDIETNRLMKSYQDNILTFADGASMYAGMVIWTAGVSGVPFEFKGASVPQIGPGGRILCDNFNRVEGVEDIYAIGDISYTSTTKYPKGYPQLAQVAIQQSRLLARQLNSGNFILQFEYNDKGTMATVGRNRAVADLRHIHLYGRPAWFTWMFIHLISILGMRNKLTVLINWIWAYFTYSTSLRLLLLPPRYPLRHRWGEK